MIQDIRAVMWKELLEARRGTGTQGGSNVTKLVPTIAVMALGAGLYYGSKGLGGIPTLLFAPFLTSMVVASFVPDTFAGERDRRTLETLLTTRLSDQAILLGKLASAVAIGSLIGLASVVLSVIGTNIGGLVAGKQEGVQFYPSIVICACVIVVLVAFLMSNVGVLVALRAPSAMSAQRRLMMVFFGVIIVGVPLSIPIIDVAQDIERVSPVLMVVFLLLVFAVLNVAIFMFTRTRFTRERIIRH